MVPDFFNSTIPPPFPHNNRTSKIAMSSPFDPTTESHTILNPSHFFSLQYTWYLLYLTFTSLINHLTTYPQSHHLLSQLFNFALSIKLNLPLLSKKYYIQRASSPPYWSFLVTRTSPYNIYSVVITWYHTLIIQLETSFKFIYIHHSRQYYQYKPTLYHTSPHSLVLH